jgi:hypothetical protein
MKPWPQLTGYGAAAVLLVLFCCIADISSPTSVLQGIDPCRTEGKRKETTGRLYLEERRTSLLWVDIDAPAYGAYSRPAPR